MIDKPYCKEHYAECICSRCKYDREDCCGRGSFTSYLCPFSNCSEFKEKEPPERREPEQERGS